MDDFTMFTSRLSCLLENQRDREEEANIKEDNETIAFIHEILAADLENERQEQVKPDTFSQEEPNTLMKWAMESEIKKAEMWYWFRIGILKAEGLTVEQAREKMYQDLIDKGSLKAAKLMREFQDKVHPLGKNDQILPPSPA
jgi:hypothetical protein